jgi:hypothetical protein
MSGSHTLIEFDEYIAPDGEVYEFHDGEARFLLGIGGQGMPPIEYRTQRGPFQHGETPLAFHLRPRVIQMVHRRQDCQRMGHWDARGDIMNLLRPNRQAIGAFASGILRKRLPDSSIRDIDVFIESGPAFEPRRLDAWDEWAFTETIRFVAFDPVFYDPVEELATFALGDMGQLCFPICFPICFNSDTINADESLTYPGTWLSYPTIRFVGPMNGPVITNLTTGEKIDLAYTIPIGDYVVATLAYGHKTIVDNHGANLIGLLSPDSDLATFHIEPAPGAPGGINNFNVTVGGGKPGITLVTVTYHVRYIGI